METSACTHKVCVVPAESLLASALLPSLGCMGGHSSMCWGGSAVQATLHLLSLGYWLMVMAVMASHAGCCLWAQGDWSDVLGFKAVSLAQPVVPNAVLTTEESHFGIPNHMQTPSGSFVGAQWRGSAVGAAQVWRFRQGVNLADSFVLCSGTQTNVVEKPDPHLKVDLYDNQYI